MTEDDTFLKLKRIHFMSMHKLWMESPLPPISTVPLSDAIPAPVEEFFRQYGWTYTEWRDVYSEYRDRERNFS